MQGHGVGPGYSNHGSVHRRALAMTPLSCSRFMVTEVFMIPPTSGPLTCADRGVAGL